VTEDTDPVAVETRDPAEVFGLLAAGARVDVLRALAAHPEDAVSFSALFDDVEAVGDSGNFSYHLEKLREAFVREADGGYVLTHAGRQVVGAIHAGSYTADAAVDPVDAGWDCQRCGGRMTVAYADGAASIECRDCGSGARIPLPPGTVDQVDRAAFPEAAAAWYHQRVRRTLDGFCADCSGRIDAELVSAPTADGPSFAEFSCPRCGRTATLSGATIATFHPVVEGFLVEHGFDTTARHPSQIWPELDDTSVSMRSRDPTALAFRFEHDGEAVSVDVAPDASVEAVDRFPVE
jgi:hypothetical protein